MLLLQNQRNTKKQGDVGLATAIAWFVQNGYGVAIPLTDSQDYDLVIEYEDNFYSVQVRTTYALKKGSGNYQLNLQVSGGNRSGTGKVKLFDPTKVNYVFAITNTGDMYFIPSGHIEGRRSISLCDKYARYKVT